MSKAILRRRFGMRVRRFFRRRAFWMLALVALGCVIIWREAAARRPELRPAMVAIDIQQYPAIADKPVRLLAGRQHLRDILADLFTQAGVRFEVDWVTLQSLGMDGGLLIDVRKVASEQDPTRDWSGMVPLKEAVRMAMWGRGAADFSTDPVFISTTDEINSAKRQVMVMYPVQDILQVNSPWVYRNAPEERRRTLESMMEFTVEPRVWMVQGGTASLAVDDDGRMIVTATPGVQFEVKQVLEALRKR